MWLDELRVPREAFDLMYHLGQKVLYYDRVRVEYFAPYLLKDGLVQKMLLFKERGDEQKEDLEAVVQVSSI